MFHALLKNKINFKPAASTSGDRWSQLPWASAADFLRELELESKTELQLAATNATAGGCDSSIGIYREVN